MSLRLSPQPAPSITTIVSAATLKPGASPGEAVSIFGANLATQPVSTKYDSGGLYPTSLTLQNFQGTIRDVVTFNGVAAPLLYTSTGQINALVPYEVAGQKAVDVVVTHNQSASPPFSVPILDTSPGIFTATQTGTGQGAILNTDPANPNIVTVNSVANPAPKGSAIVIFATGAGLWNRPVVFGGPIQDGSVILDIYTIPAASVSLTVGGLAATIYYAGAAPYEVSGMLQVNALLPAGLASGQQPLVLKIGENSNAQQQVTVAVN